MHETIVIWGDEFASYDFGPMHPLRPVRLELTMALAREVGALGTANVVAPRPADQSILELVHTPEYIGAVREAPHGFYSQLRAYGLGPGDNPIFAGMHEASSLVAGASVQAAQAVWDGGVRHAVNISGGLHHAMPSMASGFCIYDDPALAIAWLLEAGAERVAYVDVDVHHGDGVQAAFYADPRVLTISIHEAGAGFFPGTGWREEVGLGAGTGSSMNVPLAAGADDESWHAAFDAEIPERLREFRPQIIVSQMGCDTHALDPLAHFDLTLSGQRRTYAKVHALAHELCDGKWVVTGGGGYDPARIVPRSWAALLAEVTGSNLPETIPENWLSYAKERTGLSVPAHFS